MRTAELDMAASVYPADIDTFIDNAVWAIRSTYHTVLKTSPGAAIFGRDMLFDIPFIADWHKIGDYRSSGAHKVQLKVVFLILKYYLGLALCIDSYVFGFFLPLLLRQFLSCTLLTT